MDENDFLLRSPVISSLHMKGFSRLNQRLQYSLE